MKWLLSRIFVHVWFLFFFSKRSMRGRNKNEWDVSGAEIISSWLLSSKGSSRLGIFPLNLKVTQWGNYISSLIIIAICGHMYGAWAYTYFLLLRCTSRNYNNVKNVHLSSWMYCYLICALPFFSVLISNCSLGLPIFLDKRSLKMECKILHFCRYKRCNIYYSLTLC
jgi:hypothetical protein